jgi:O-methyltransferase
MTFRTTARKTLDRLGLLGAARAWTARHGTGRVAFPMRFPTFGPDIERAAVEGLDYVRHASFALAIRTIEREGIAGAFAELGVYRGATSRFLRRCAPDRRLYLFDTFEGFPAADREPENLDDTRFRDTSEDQVRRAIGDSPNVVIRKGRFPETTAGLEEERFAFVLLDLDVYPPTLAGLRFFYPRLSPGAYVFVHDYNSPESNAACSRAVQEALAGRPERIVEIPDVWGSVVFRKV